MIVKNYLIFPVYAEGMNVAEVTVFQITQTQGLIAIVMFIFGLGAAWATLKMSVKAITENLGKIEKTVNTIQSSISNHKADIAGLKAHTKYGISGSPMIPSAAGKKLLESSGFNAQYEQIKQKIFHILDARKPRTLYDVEKFSYEALKSISDDPIIDPLKEYVVNHPDETLDIVFTVGSWVLRDDYAKHTGIPVKHDKKLES